MDSGRNIGIEGVVWTEEGAGGLELLRVANRYADAAIYLHGAHVASFRPHGAEDLLWMSPASAFAEGKPIRGGIPICFPWFGPHPERADFPLHGFVRLHDWTPVFGAVLHDGRTRVALETVSTAVTREFWPYDFRLELVVTVGATLELELAIHNTGKEPFACGECLHTYFRVGDVARVSLSGLDGTAFLDRTRQDRLQIQAGDVAPDDEINAAWAAAPDALVLADFELDRRIAIRKRGFAGTVVWNAWETRALGIPDIGPAWREYLCVEAGNILASRVVLPPGACHRGILSLGIE